MRPVDMKIGERRNRLTRRQFIAMAVAAATVTGEGWTAQERDTTDEAMPTWLIDAVEQPESAARFGATYLVDHPREQDATKLAAAIRRALDAFHGVPGTEGRRLGFALLDHVVREEYAQGEVVLVERWLLSRTEARLYALVALSSLQTW